MVACTLAVEVSVHLDRACCHLDPGLWVTHLSLGCILCCSKAMIFKGTTMKDFCVLTIVNVLCGSVAQLCPTLCDPWTVASQAPLSFTVSWNLLKLMFTESMISSNHFILCHPLFLLPSIFLSIRVFFQWVSSSHQVAKVLELQHHSFQWLFRVDFL